MHSYRMTEVGKCCLCPNIVFADEVLAPMTSTVFKKYFAPVLNNQDLPYLILSSTVEWQKPLLNHLFEIYGLLSENENVNDNSTERCVIKPIESACPEIEIHQKLISIFQILYCHQNELSHINSSKGNQQTQIRIQKCYATYRNILRKKFHWRIWRILQVSAEARLGDVLKSTMHSRQWGMLPYTG